MLVATNAAVCSILVYTHFCRLCMMDRRTRPAVSSAIIVVAAAALLCGIAPLLSAAGALYELPGVAAAVLRWFAHVTWQQVVVWGLIVYVQAITAPVWRWGTPGALRKR